MQLEPDTLRELQFAPGKLKAVPLAAAFADSVVTAMLECGKTTVEEVMNHE